MPKINPETTKYYQVLFGNIKRHLTLSDNRLCHNKQQFQHSRGKGLCRQQTPVTFKNSNGFSNNSRKMWILAPPRPHHKQSIKIVQVFSCFNHFTRVSIQKKNIFKSFTHKQFLWVVWETSFGKIAKKYTDRIKVKKSQVLVCLFNH